MANIYLSEAAKTDLTDARRYIANELQNQTAAQRVVAKIVKSMRVLEQFPFSGTPLQIAETDTGYRVVTSGNYRIFYRCDENSVYIIRVLYGHRDYMRILFGIFETQNDE